MTYDWYNYREINKFEVIKICVKIGKGINYELTLGYYVIIIALAIHV